jgi:glycine hydroxymethyltransferase
VTSGLRLGSAAQTTAGMGPDQFATIGTLIGRTLRQRDDEKALAAIRAEVRELCAAFPPYPTLGGA